MAACKVSDQSFNRSRLPPGFEDLLNDLVRSIIANQPLELLDHIADYLEALTDRRTLWDMQLQRGMQQRQKPNIVKCETDKMATRDTHPCPAPPKQPNAATRNLPSPQNECNKVGSYAQDQAKLRPPTACGQPIRSLAKRTPDAWADDTVLASHLAQHEALRQVIREIEYANEEIIALEENVRNGTHCAKKPRNITQGKDLANKHSRLKSALDKMMLICTWIKSNELGSVRSLETCENPVGKATDREQGVNVNQGTLENQIDTLKGTVEYIQSALIDKRKRGAPGEDIVLSDTMGQISSENRGCRENAKTLDDIAKLSQWLQYMFQLLSKNGVLSQAAAPPALLGSSQNIVMLTDTSEAKTADSSPRKQKKLNVDTASSPIPAGTSSSVPGKLTKAATARHHQPTPANLRNEPCAEVDRKKETHINLQYYANETDKKKDTRVILVSTTGRECHTSTEATHATSKPVGSQTSTTSGMILDGTPDTKNYQKAEAEAAQQKAKSPPDPANTDSRRCSIPVPLRKPPKPASTTLNASESELAKLQVTAKVDRHDKKGHKEILTDERPKSQTTNNDSNITNIDSQSAFAKLDIPLSHESFATSSKVDMFYTQSTSSVSENSWYPKQTTAGKTKEKRRARKYETPRNDDVCEPSQPPASINATTAGTDPREFDNIFPASGGSSVLSVHAQMHISSVKEIKTSSSSEKIPYQTTNEQVLSNEIISTSFIKSSSYATANLTIQKGVPTTPSKEKPDTLQPNGSSRSLVQSSSHAASKSTPQKGDTAKPVVDTTAKSSPPKDDPKKPSSGTILDNLQPTVYSSSTNQAKLSSHSTVKSDSRKGDAGQPSKEAIPTAPPPNDATSASFTKASSHSTAKQDPKKGDISSASKEVISTDPPSKEATSPSFAKASSHSSAKTSPSTSFAKTGQTVSTAASQKEKIPSSSKELSSKSNKADTITKEANPESLHPNSASSLGSTKRSTHSTTKSGTQKAIPLSAEPLTDDKPSPRYVEYHNIFPQISGMIITPEPSQSMLNRKQLSSSSARNLNKGPEASRDGGALSAGVSSIERVKTQKAAVSEQQTTKTTQKTETTKPVATLAHADDPVEKAFSKLSNMSSAEVTQEGGNGGAKQAESESKSKDSVKLEKTSIKSASKTSTSSNKESPESGTENKGSAQ